MRCYVATVVFETTEEGEATMKEMGQSPTEYFDCLLTGLFPAHDEIALVSVEKVEVKA